MHQTMKELLPNITGVSESIIAVNLDIRGFYKFSLIVDPVAIAEYIKKIYSELINVYFTNVSFFKTTGDGLLITIPYTNENIQTLTSKTIETCLKVVQNFSKICINDPMINLETPQNIGIGLSRGPACRLVSDNQTLDYSGNAVILASKLMGIARPAGIVFDDSIGTGLLSTEQRELFEKEIVYIPGVAESQTIDIWYTKDLTEILPVWKQPILTSIWQTEEDVKTLRQIKEAASKRNWFGYPLSSTPRNFDATRVQIEHPAVIGGNRSETITRHIDFRDFNHYIEADKFTVRVNFAELAKILVDNEVDDDWEVIIRIIYKQK